MVPRHPKKPQPTYLGASVMPGDDVLGPDENQAHIGLLVLTDHLQWVPEQGDGWTVPIDQIDVESPPGSWRDAAGIVLALPDGENVCVFGRIQGGAFGFVTRRGYVSPPITSDIRRELLTRGATDKSRPTPTEQG